MSGTRRKTHVTEAEWPVSSEDCVAITTAMYRLQFLGHRVERYAALATG